MVLLMMVDNLNHSLVFPSKKNMFLGLQPSFAGTLDNTGREILDSAVFQGRGITPATPFAAGTGHVRPQVPRPLYDAGERDYVNFLCAPQLHRGAATPVRA